jgi:hypothetical protein
MQKVLCPPSEQASGRGSRNRRNAAKLGKGKVTILTSPDGTDSDGSVLDQSYLVELRTALEQAPDSSRADRKGIKKRADDGPTTVQTPPRPPSNVLDLLKSVTAPEHRFGTVLVMQIMTAAGMRFTNFAFWFANMPYEARRKRLTSWKIWCEYCEDSQTSVEVMRRTQRPTFIITDFIIHM